MAALASTSSANTVAGRTKVFGAGITRPRYGF
jgi:hypothetical protein